MAKQGPNWDGLLKWSLSHSDGTGSNRNLSEEDRRWFTEAMQAQTVDVVKRMREITQVMLTPQEDLDAQGVAPAEIEDMLDELQEHVESIDMANDLHSIGGLVPLLGCLKSSHPNIRAKAAEVLSTMVQNNPRSQQLVMEANGIEPLLSNFASDPDVTVRTKALGAISSLIRDNKPAISAFGLGNGYTGLKDALSSDNVRFQRKALNLIYHLLKENSADCTIVDELGLPCIFAHLASSDDRYIREAALGSLIEVVQPGGLGDEDEKMKRVLEDRIECINLMSPEDVIAAKEERQLVDLLWRTYFSGPSPLEEKGLLAVPGEDHVVSA